jgi:DNA primase
MPKIHCLNPEHRDKNPSMEVYPDGVYCWVCGYNSDLSKVPTELIGVTIEELKHKKEKENIQEKFAYIDSLDKRKIRGLDLPADSSGYYVCWPDRKYYKLRRYDDRPRYVGPRGHRPGLFRIEPEHVSKSLVITEGELNSLSLQKAIPDHRFCIVSPGSATELSRHIDYYSKFSSVCIIVDKDAPGVYYGLELRKKLLGNNRRVILEAVEKDFNQILQDSGPEAVKLEFERIIGV